MENLLDKQRICIYIYACGRSLWRDVTNQKRTVAGLSVDRVPCSVEIDLRGRVIITHVHGGVWRRRVFFFLPSCKHRPLLAGERCLLRWFSRCTTCSFVRFSVTFFFAEIHTETHTPKLYVSTRMIIERVPQPFKRQRFRQHDKCISLIIPLIHLGFYI